MTWRKKNYAFAKSVCQNGLAQSGLNSSLGGLTSLASMWLGPEEKMLGLPLRGICMKIPVVLDVISVQTCGSWVW
jgi:hypothetical protein